MTQQQREERNAIICVSMFFICLLLMLPIAFILYKSIDQNCIDAQKLCKKCVDCIKNYSQLCNGSFDRDDLAICRECKEYIVKCDKDGMSTECKYTDLNECSKQDNTFYSLSMTLMILFFAIPLAICLIGGSNINSYENFVAKERLRNRIRNESS